MPFQAPQNIIFLARCVSILSGMCTGLNPNFNVWQHLAPFARKLMTEEARKSGQTWLNEAEKVGRSVLAVPQKLDRVLAKLERGDVAVRSPELTTELQRLEAALHRLTGAVVFAALLLSGLQLVLSRQEWWGAGLLGAAGLTLLRVIFKRR
jgi:predicted unusual protein kinase regulating ubiquinone biosynthesis (AarF/ABC1/UbiB family)